jgi:glycosyltransferase involved in cell wall biosynthesis
MKVCFISHSAAKGGAERSLLELVDVLREKGIEGYVVLPVHGPLVEELTKRGIAFCILPYKWWMGKDSPTWKRMGRILLNLVTIIPLVLRIKRWECDAVCTNTVTVCVGAFAARLLELPHLWYIREFGYEDHGLLFDLGSKLSLWLINHLSTICIVNSNAVARQYQQYIDPSKLRVIYQSVSVPKDISAEEVPMAPNTGIRCVIAGALQEGKRQEEAILAIGELVHAGINAELFIVGDGNPKYRDYLQKLVSENELDRYVKFIGYVENPFPFVKSADVVLMCSRNEAFGRVTVEAMKIGKPVIGARSGGTIELIRDGFNGFLYTPGDYKELATKIKYLYEHPDVVRDMGHNGLQWATERFTQERYGEEVLTILGQLVH